MTAHRHCGCGGLCNVVRECPLAPWCACRMATPVTPRRALLDGELELLGLLLQIDRLAGAQGEAARAAGNAKLAAWWDGRALDACRQMTELHRELDLVLEEQTKGA